MPRKPSTFDTDLEFLLHIMEVKVCNCARCGKLLSSPEDYARVHRDTRKYHPREVTRVPLPVVARVSGRPYCAPCFAVVKHRRPA